MNITFDELRNIKHSLPHGGITKIARKFNLDEQVVRNYFGAHHLENSGNNLEPGPNGGIVHIEDEAILDYARKLIAESEEPSNGN